MAPLAQQRDSEFESAPQDRAELAVALERQMKVRRSLDTLRSVLLEGSAGRVAVVSSFGGESAVLLALVAEIKPDAPVIFLETGKHFPETLRHRDQLAAQLGLTNVQSITPAEDDLAEDDPQGTLWAKDTDRCCTIRKVLPLERALSGYDSWITGRKRFQAATRNALPLVEWDGLHVKVNPLADWTKEDLAAFMEERALPSHPLTAQGFPSIGCMPCTSRVEEGADERSGRWQGSGKVECGIHLGRDRAA
ncbi:phosphoadenylyl-sulfate reductase [Amorphus orientalis]|uniref:Adenosine 5'-phosphosulfate reductase n=1 Tax=Amorphus orientalis TaxID=649198 RepID=A0AAE4ASL2_9HYPH|nr:phosphoadenylyl-sulfate reductase [Amorphus orientalis]MDQ0315237.1 phosphoadenosine phosphosulfate reductase [Amorphus orientalis]